MLLVNLRTQPRPPDLQSCKLTSPASYANSHPVRRVQPPPARAESEHGSSTPTRLAAVSSAPSCPLDAHWRLRSTNRRSVEIVLDGRAERARRQRDTVTMGPGTRIWRGPPLLGSGRSRRVGSSETSIRGLQGEGQPRTQAGGQTTSPGGGRIGEARRMAPMATNATPRIIHAPRGGELVTDPSCARFAGAASVPRPSSALRASSSRSTTLV